MSGHNGAIAGLAVIAIVMVFASGWVAQIKAHIQGVQSVNAPVRVSTDPNPPAGSVIDTSSVGGAPIQIITGNIQAGQ